MKKEEIASYIDHTYLQPDATIEDIKRVCDEAIKYGFKSVCVNPSYVEQVASFLEGEEPIAVTVVGFPLGASGASSKAFEAKEAISLGAKEIDMVINISALKAKDYETVYQDILGVVTEAAPHPVKVILETCYLTDEEKIIACALAKVANAAFVKTSTGFGKGGATVEDVALMRRVVGPDMGVKASGNIRSKDDALKMIQAGANRLGTSSSVKIITG